MRVGSPPAQAYGQIGRPEVVYPIILKDKKMPIDFFDDMKTPDVRETKPMILAMSLSDAVADLEEKLGDDMSQWQWGKIHKVRAHHALGGRFNIEQQPSDGGTDSVNVTGFNMMGDNFNFGGGPNMRFTVELTPDGPRAQNVILGGQSGDQK